MITGKVYIDPMFFIEINRYAVPTDDVYLWETSVNSPKSD